MKYLLITLLFTVALFSNEVKIDGEYSSSLTNPFLEVLETKKNNVAIDNTKSKLITVEVISNQETIIAGIPKNKESFTIDTNSCNLILKQLLNQNYNIDNGKSGSSISLNCKVINPVLKLDYFKNMISDIDLSIGIELQISNVKGIIYLDNKMNKDLGITGYDHDHFLISAFKSRLSSEEKIQQMFEILIFRTLNQYINKKGL